MYNWMNCQCQRPCRTQKNKQKPNTGQHRTLITRGEDYCKAGMQQPTPLLPCTCQPNTHTGAQKVQNDWYTVASQVSLMKLGMAASAAFSISVLCR